MRKIPALLLLLPVLWACGSSPTSSGVPGGTDTIASFRFLHDTTIVDANPVGNAFPRAVTTDSGIHIEQLVGVTCGYAYYSVWAAGDTLEVRAMHQPPGSCVDWMARFQLIADVAVVGKCRYVRFRTGTSLTSTSPDTLLRL